MFPLMNLVARASSDFWLRGSRLRRSWSPAFLLACSCLIGLSAPGIAATWTAAAPIPAARVGSAAVAANGILYVAGGWNDGAANDVYAFDSSSNSWSTRASMPDARYSGAGAVLLNGKIYLAGGWTTAPPLPNSNLWEYDPATNAWSARASMPTLSACGASGAINGKLYVTTACDGSSGYRNYLHAWDPASNSWSQLAGSVSAHSAPAYGVIGGKLYLAGGVDDASATIGLLEAYDPASNAWTTLAPMPTPRSNTAGAVVGGKLYVAGGYLADGSASSIVQAYDPVSDSWSTLSAMPAARGQLAAAVVNNVAYFIGGFDGAAAVSVVAAMTPDGGATTTTTAASTSTTASSTTTTLVAPLDEVTLSLEPGWNLVGNGLKYELNVAASFGDASKVTTVWKWVASKSSWAFYTPSLIGQQLTDYASNKGYEVLTTISGGDGFWVNAKTGFSVRMPAGSTVTAVSLRASLLAGWNLIAIGDNKAPGEINQALSLTPPLSGNASDNVITLWAWDALLGNWYFYAPSLLAQGISVLSDYIIAKGYLDFGAKLLESTTGFWVNLNAATGDSTATTSTTSTTVDGATTTTVPGGAFHVDISLARGTVTFPNKYSTWTIGGAPLTNYVAFPSGWLVGGSSTNSYLAIPPGWTLGGAALSNYVAVPPGWTVGGSSMGCYVPIPPGWSVGGSALTNFIAVPPGWSVGGSSTSHYLALPPAWTVAGSALTNWVALPPGWSLGGASGTNFVGLASGWTSGGSAATNFSALPPGWTLGGGPLTNYVALPPGWVLGGAAGTNYVAYPSDSVSAIELAFNDPGHLAMFQELQASGQYTEQQLADIVMATYLNGASFWRWPGLSAPRFSEPSGMWLGAKLNCTGSTTSTTTTTTASPPATTTTLTDSSHPTTTTTTAATTTTTASTTTTEHPTTSTSSTNASTTTTTAVPTTSTTAPVTTTTNTTAPVTTTTSTTAPVTTTTTTASTTTTTMYPPVMLTTLDRTCPVDRYCSVSLVATTSGGNPPYHYQMDTLNTPPMGMTLGTDGVLSGTPRTVGTHSFWICAVDLSGNTNCQTVTVTVTGGISGPWAGAWRVTSPTQCNWYSGTWTATFEEQTNGTLGGTWESDGGVSGQLSGQRTGANANWSTGSGGGVTFNGTIVGTTISGGFSNVEHCWISGVDYGQTSGTFEGAMQ